MRNTVFFSKLLIPACAAGFLTCIGCSTPKVDVGMKVAGEFKLPGVSKIAVVNFNSLPDDPFSGNLAADAETCALVKRGVASAFARSHTFQTIDMDIECAIKDLQNCSPGRRYDAVMCGRVWWHVTPETNRQYPETFTLYKWRMVPYTVTNSKGKSTTYHAKVTSESDEVLKMIDYRVQDATLMLSLSLYRLDGNGGVSKVVEIYEVGTAHYSTDRKIEGKWLPAELQEKLELVSAMSGIMGAKLAPHIEKHSVALLFGDEKLGSLLKAGAYGAVCDYAAYALHQKFGRQVCDRIPEMTDYKTVSYPIPDSEEKPADEEELKEVLVDEDAAEYLYAMALGRECLGQSEAALSSYRHAFDLNPELRTAQGISRCLRALGQADRLRETDKEIRKALKKTELN